jgi:methyl-accepting chemotaxis protein
MTSPTSGTSGGSTVWIIKLSVPIVNPSTNEIVGLVGCTLDISTVQQPIENTMQNNAMLGGMGIYYNDGFVMASFQRDRVGKNMKDVEVMFGN